MISKFIKKVVFLFLIAVVLFVVFGCSQKKFSSSDWTSDLRTTFYDFNSENEYVNFVSGMRENPYNYDGVHNSLVEFGILSVWFNDSKYSPPSLDFTIKIGGEVFEGVLEKSPFEEGFMADIEKYVTCEDDICLTIGENLKYNLSCQTKNFTIDASNALSIGETELSGVIAENYKDGKLNGECYLKIIFDKSRKIKTYYWYFAFLDQNGKFSSCVIDTETGEVLAKV